MDVELTGFQPNSQTTPPVTSVPMNLTMGTPFITPHHIHCVHVASRHAMDTCDVYLLINFTLIGSIMFAALNQLWSALAMFFTAFERGANAINQLAKVAEINATAYADEAQAARLKALEKLPAATRKEMLAIETKEEAKKLAAA